MKKHYAFAFLTGILFSLFSMAQQVTPPLPGGKAVRPATGIQATSVRASTPSLQTVSTELNRIAAPQAVKKADIPLSEFGKQIPQLDPASAIQRKSGRKADSDKWNAPGKLFLAEYAGLSTAPASKSGGSTARQNLEDRFGLCCLSANGKKSTADYIPVLLSYHQPQALQQAESFGFIPQIRMDGMCTGLFPLSAIEQIQSIEGIDRISVSLKAEKNNDLSRQYSKVDQVQTAYAANGLSMPYDGTGVVVGIIDMGFDYTHPAFYTDPSDPSTYRVKRVWDQLATDGTAPSGYSLGVEYRTTETILTAQHDHHDGEHHGTHVAATAAGSGYGTNYSGMAPGADIVFVSTTMQFNDILQGVKYIQDYAKAAGKPSVINMSLGSDLGPHSGKSDIDKAFDAMVSPGHLLVGSAGNSGGKTIHASEILQDNNTFWWGVEISDPAQPALIDVYDMENGSGIQVCLVNKSTATIEEYALYYTSPGYHEDQQIINYQGQPLLYLSGQNATEGNYANLLLQMQLLSELPDDYALAIGTFAMYKGQSTRFHAWTQGASFSDYGTGYLRSGDSEYTHNGRLSAADNVLSVAAYTSRPFWTDINGDFWNMGETENEICTFSSRGPRIDGSAKPDIAAPGSAIISAGNSFSPVDDIMKAAQTDIAGKTWPWMIMQGTSMSAPAVSGMTALLLQQNNELDITTLKGLLKETALRDEAVKRDGKNRWGAGKIDILQALQTLESGYEHEDYYAAAQGKTGFELKTALHEIISNHTVRTYNQLKTDMTYTDAREDGSVWDMYSALTTTWDWGASATTEGEGINREHSFPKSWFGGEVEPMYTDLFHLYPTDIHANSMRGNLPFGEVASLSWEGTLSRTGLSATPGYNAEVFEPADEYKGDFARTYFYMVTRYEDQIDRWMTPVLDGSNDYGLGKWSIDLLLKWHRQDPVSVKEENRNEAVFQIQGNRNPFIDYPQWAEEIWEQPKTSVTYPYNDGILLITEYVSGLRYGKPQRAIELYNPTPVDIDLSAYCLKFERNGNGGYRDSLPLKGIVNAHSCFVIANNETEDGTLLFADQFDQSQMTFNGNDAVALFHNGILMDEVGVSGSAEYWGQDQVLRRKLSVEYPSTTYNSEEWLSFNYELTGDLGVHGNSTYNPSSLYDVTVLGDKRILLSYTKQLVALFYNDARDFYVCNSEDGSYYTSAVQFLTAPNNTITMELAEPLLPGKTYTLEIGSFIDRWGFTTSSRTHKGIKLEDNVCPDIASLRNMPADKTTEYTLGSISAVTAIGSMYNQKWIQDASGAGIMIHDPDSLITGYYPQGYNISKIRGTLSEYYGALQFIPVRDAYKEPFLSVTIQPQLLQPEEGFDYTRLKPLEGRLVKIAGCRFEQTGTFENGQNYTAVCQGVQLPVRIHIWNTDVTGSPIPTEETTLTGIVVAQNNNYYITPRSKADIQEKTSREIFSIAELLQSDADQFTEYILLPSCAVTAADPEQNRLWIQDLPEYSGSILVEYPQGLLSDIYTTKDIVSGLRGTLSFDDWIGVHVFTLTEDIQKEEIPLESELAYYPIEGIDIPDYCLSAYVKFRGSYKFADTGTFQRDQVYPLFNYERQTLEMMLYIHGTELEGQPIPEGLVNISGIVVSDQDGIRRVAPRSMADIVPAEMEVVKTTLYVGDIAKEGLRVKMSFFDPFTGNLSSKDFITDKNGSYVFEAYAGTSFATWVEATENYFFTKTEENTVVEPGQREYALGLYYYYPGDMEPPVAVKENGSVYLQTGKVLTIGTLNHPTSTWAWMYRLNQPVGIRYTPEDMAFMGFTEQDTLIEISFPCITNSSSFSYRLTLYAGADRSEVLLDTIGQTPTTSDNSIQNIAFLYNKPINTDKDLWVMIEYMDIPDGHYPYFMPLSVPFRGKNDLWISDRQNPALDLSLCTLFQNNLSVSCSLKFTHWGKLAASSYRYKTYAQNTEDEAIKGPELMFHPDSSRIGYPAWSSLPVGSYKFSLAIWNGSFNIRETFSNSIEKEEDIRLCTVNIVQTPGGTVHVYDDMAEPIPSGSELPAGTNLQIGASPEEGYRFVSWMDGSTEIRRFLKIYDDMEISAVFEEIPTYLLTIQPAEGGTVTAYDDLTGERLVSGKRYSERFIRLAAIPAEGYMLRSWSFLDLAQSPVGLYLDRDTSIGATFIPVTAGDEFFPVTIRQTTGGTLRMFYNGMEFTELTQGYEIPAGSIITVQAAADPMYEAHTWWDGQAVTSTSRSFVLEEATELSVEFRRNAFRVDIATSPTGSIQAFYDGTVFVSGNAVPKEAELRLIATPTSGYSFEQWWDGERSPERFLKVEEDLRISAVFTRQTMYRISIPVYEEGLISVTDATTGREYRDGDSVEPGTVVNISATAYQFLGDKSYRFVSWWDGDQTNPRTYPILSDLEISAVFREARNYTLSIRQTEGGSVSVFGPGNEPVQDGALYPEGTLLTLEATPDENYVFYQWWDGHTQSLRYDFEVTADVEISADFLLLADPEIMYPVTIEQAENGRIEVRYNNRPVSSGDLLPANTVLTLTAVPERDYVFSHWWDEQTLNPRNVVLTENLSISAVFTEEIRQYPVTIYQTTGGIVSVLQNGQAVTTGSLLEEGSTIELIAEPNPGYSFLKWWDGNTQTPRSVEVTRALVIQAEFFPTPVMEYTVEIAPSENGTISVQLEGEEVVSGQKIEEGSVLTLKATPDAGYRLNYWWDGSKDSVRPYTVSEDVTVSARFEAIPAEKFQVDILAADHGSIQVECNGKPVASGDLLEKGSELKLTAQADEGYTFEKWWDGQTTPTRTYVLDAAVEISATFKALEEPEPEKFEVTIVQNEGGQIKVYLGEDRVYSGDMVEKGSRLRLTAEPEEGYRFEKWWNGEKEPEIYHTLNAAVTIRAEFIEEVSIEEDSDLAVSLWPNPSTGLFYLQTASKMEARVFSHDGRLLTTYQWESPGRQTIDLRSHTAGLYYLHLMRDGEGKEGRVYYKVLKLIIR